MELSRITLYPAVEGADSVYFKGGRLGGGVLTLEEGECADFASLFSALDAQFLLERTTVRGVTLRLYFDGRAKITVTRYIAQDKPAVRGAKPLTSYTVSTAETENGYRTDIELYGGGIVAFRVTALGALSFYGGVWECDDSCRTCDVRPGVVLPACGDIGRLAVPLARLCTEIDGLEAYVIGDVSALDGGEMPGVRLIECRDLGACGYYARGMMECVERGRTHCLLTDPTVTFDPAAVRRALAYVSVMKPEYYGCALGGGLLTAARPTVVSDAGGVVRGAVMSHPKSGIDASDVGGLLWYRSEEDSDFADWHFFILPVSAVKSVGLPMPFRTGWYAAEYGLRLKAEAETLFPLGVAVWKTESSDGGDWEAYYDMRNALVTCAVSGNAKAGTMRRALSAACRAAHGNRTRLAYVFDGADDYLLGPGFLTSVGCEKLHAEVLEGPRKMRGHFAAGAKKRGLKLRMLFSRSLGRKYMRLSGELRSERNWRIRLGLPGAGGAAEKSDK